MKMLTSCSAQELKTESNDGTKAGEVLLDMKGKKFLWIKRQYTLHIPKEHSEDNL